MLPDGCTDVAATNYDASAQCDDGSCVYPSPFDILTIETVDNTTAGFTAGEVTYRLYANFTDPAAKLLQIFGDETNPHLIQTTTTFFQDPFGQSGSYFQQTVNQLYFGPPYNDPAAFPMFAQVPFDSWVTIGDNYTPAVGVASLGDLQFSGFDASAWSFGGTVNSDASIFITPDQPECLPDASNRILIAQITTSGILSGYINLGGIDGNGTAWQETNIPIPALTVSGCTDATACNYDNTANTDDGSCILPDGCTDPLYVEYDVSAQCDDGSCTTLIVSGCTEPTAFKYD